MRRSSLILAALILLAATFAIASPAPSPAPDDDIAAIKNNTVAFQAAWNKHDPKAIADFWAQDGDLIDPWGVTSVGRDAVEKFFTAEHTGSGKLAKSTYQNKKDSVRLITPDIALQDWEVVLTGLADGGKPLGPQFHRVVLVCKKEGARWMFAGVRPGIPGPVADAAPGKAPAPSK